MGKLYIAGTMLTSEDCNNIYNFRSASGRVSYDPSTKTLTLDNATITCYSEECECIRNYIDGGITIKLIGSNTIIPNKERGIYNNQHLTIKGVTSDATLTVRNSHMNPEIGYLSDACIYNEDQVEVTVKDCALIVDGEGKGLVGGKWHFINCTVRAKGGRFGSFIWLDEVPSFKDCTPPAGTYWKKKESGTYSLFGADDKVVTDWVTVAEATGNTNGSGYTGGSGNTSDSGYTGGSGNASEADYTRQRHEDINAGLREIKHNAYALLNSDMYDDNYSYPEAIEDASDRDFAYILDKRESSFSEKEIYVRGSGYENIYPGAILFVDSDITSGSPNPLGRIPRSKISIYGDFLAGGNPSQSDIDPNNSDVRMAINNIMHTLLSDSRYDAPGAQRPRTKIHTSQKSLMMDLGVDSSFAGCNVNVRASTTSSEQSFVQATTLDQDYFTIRLKDDWHQDPASLFADEVTWDDLSNELNGKAIAIVTSVTYGRTFSYMKEYSARQFTFDSSQKVSGYGQSADASQSLAESSSYTNDEIFNLGGTSLTISALRGKSTQQELEEAMADNMRFSHANQGVITKYTLQLITGPTPGTVVRPLYSGTQYQIGYTKCPRRLFAHIDVSRVHIGPGKVKVQLDVDCFRITEDGEIDIFKSVDGGSSERDQDPWYYTFSNSRNREYGNLDSGEYIYKNPLLRIRSKRGGGSYTADDERRLTAREMETGALNISLSGSVYDSVKIRDLEPFNP
ncbi:translation elongation factor P [Prevotella intermedia]|uniref:Translation elongation factor P n=1 Tax=Prevotella intermedia TaxID=28131 RepID=A0AAD1BIF3_PREIN|nr:thiol-activated cytolysin family protein [Prevotella intermedia]AFJ09005.1 thiol-activated cytolysin [Prevotella intermedia 17]APW34548.1 thiol-activated cytolysin [Prevotella intermedia]BAR95758.1 translation elongation factor P [Prevotella intermedia]